MPKIRTCILTDIVTGESFTFLSTNDAEIFLGCPRGHIHRRINQDNPIIGKDGATYSIRRMEAVSAPHPHKDDLVKKISSPPQLCWSCRKACGGCAWSAKFEPIEGWTAEPVQIRRDLTHTESYSITACPQYIYG